VKIFQFSLSFRLKSKIPKNSDGETSSIFMALILAATLFVPMPISKAVTTNLVYDCYVSDPVTLTVKPGDVLVFGTSCGGGFVVSRNSTLFPNAPTGSLGAGNLTFTLASNISATTYSNGFTLGAASYTQYNLVVQSNLAAELAQAYRGGGLSDWYLPSSLELQTLINLTTLNTTDSFNTDGNITLDGTSCGDRYMSSTEIGATTIVGVGGRSATLYNTSSKTGSLNSCLYGAAHHFRPIRSFYTATTYAMGDSGPTGGRIFYQSASNFACGPTLSGSCNTLESAPNTWASTATDPVGQWIRNNYLSTEIGIGAQRTAIGTGYANTMAIIELANLTAPTFTLSKASDTATVGSAISSYSITSTGGTIASYSISPAISNTPGLAFSISTGLISGTPTTAASSRTYTITATNAVSTANRTYSITVNTPEVVKVYIPPTPIPYLKTLTPPKLHLVTGKLVCSPGTYNTGYTLDGVIQGSPTALFTPSSFSYNLLINRVAQTSLAVTTAATSASWDVSKASSGSLVACSVTVSVNSLTNTDKSSDNTSGVSAALSTQAQAIAAAESASSEAMSANSKTYQKALVDNRSLWRKQIDAIRSNYYDTLNRIKAQGGSKMVTDTSTALKIMIAAQKKSAADYAASKPAALAAKDAANQVALDAKNAAIAKANATYGTFIESIGYGVLIP